MSKIKVMSANLANMIAAGEVIERPASVIKELVENSIDAGAKKIEISIEKAGKGLIKVKDDGCGMDKEDALLAFKRHASSKLTSIYDLMKISTLGFRGEAIPSIASISKVTMFTCSESNLAYKVESNPDEELKISQTSFSQGTCFEIRELFFNTPARLKYLKSEKTETQACIEVVQHMALGFPNISFVMKVDNNIVINTTGRNDLLEAIALIYGTNIAKNCLKFRLEGDGYQGEGYVVHPSFSYSNRYNILTFLNSRSVYMPKIQKAIIDAYKDYLPPNRYPLIFIMYQVDYSLVDVNVHPAKKEVRLSCEESLARDTYRQVLQSLTTTRASFDQVQIPQASLNKLEVNHSPLKVDNSSNSNSNLNLFDQFDLDDKKEATSKIDTNTSLFENNNKQIFQVYDSNSYIEDERNIEVKDEKIKQSNSNFPSLVPIGQVLQTYIVCDSEDGMYLIDQHAANERINFEKCEDEFDSNSHRQVPLFPIVIDLTPSLKTNYDEKHIQLLKDIGIYTSLFGQNSIKVDELPTSLTEKEDIGVINDIVNQVLSDRNISIKDVKRLAIATKACKMSIKANRVLTRDLMVTLIKNLAKCRNPLNCPHGRPTVIKISKYEIEKMFKRTGF